MNIEVRFFASLKEAVGAGSMEVSLPDGARFEQLMQILERDLEPLALQALRAENVRIALNQTLVAAPFLLAEGDEVAFMPPVTGG